MKRNVTGSNSKSEVNHTASFQAVFDSRKRKVPGLWKRGAKYYAQLRVDLGNGRTAPRRIALDAVNLEQAKAALEKTRTNNRAGSLPLPGHRPKFDDFASKYLASPLLALKKQRTQRNEAQSIRRLIEHLGGVRLDKITPAMVHAFREKRLAQGRAARTVNIDVVVLNNVLNYAREAGLIERLPEVKQLKQKPPKKRPFLSREELSTLLAAVTPEATKNSSLLRCYLRFLTLTGAREVEALKVRWADVDLSRQMVTIGNHGEAKNSESRSVDFSPELAALLAEMHAAKPPDSTWLFPSPQRGPKDIPAKSLRESLNAVKAKAGLDWVGFHDLRHFFASTCVMAGLDFMTVSQWLGHKDGGILVGKVYGHLADSHKKAAAQKLSFFPEAA